MFRFGGEEVLEVRREYDKYIWMKGSRFWLVVVRKEIKIYREIDDESGLEM